MNYIVIVNWNGWQDTIECLESVFHLEQSPFRVIVCDNASSDGSIEKIKDWAGGNLQANSISEPQLHKRLQKSPLVKPVNFIVLDNSQAFSNLDLSDTPLVLIRTGDNLGFAGGNNVGLRFAMAQTDLEYAWLLNNDTVVEMGALKALLDRMVDNSRIGICGSTVIYYHEPDKVQAFGGARYFPWAGMSMHIGRFSPRLRYLASEQVEPSLDYVMGASMLVSRHYLSEVGLMEESYFLYCEELDWALRGREQFELGYAPKSFVYHKSGASIGSGRLLSARSLLAEYYLTKNRMVITERYFRRYYPLVLLLNLCFVCLKLLRGKKDQANVGWRAIRKLPF